MTISHQYDKHGLRLLSFDGTGPGATSQLAILGELMRRIQQAKGDDEPVLPCEYFDMMDGQDIGGLLVVMFTKLRMSVEEASEEYNRIIKEIYSSGELTLEMRMSKLKARLEGLLTRRGIPIETKLRSDDLKDHCQGFVVTRPKAGNSSITKLKTYTTRNELPQPQDISIIDALLATCAVPSTSVFTSAALTFFQDGVERGRVGANNPSWEIVREAQIMFGGDASIASLVSLGGDKGYHFTSPSGNDGAILDPIRSDSEEIAKALESQIGHLGFYFRFSVEQGLNLGRGVDQRFIDSHTASYIQEPTTNEKLDRCVMVLESQLGLITFDQIVGSFAPRKVSKGLPPLTMNFVMRQGPWEALIRGLAQTAVNSLQQAIVVVSGMGGSGKTQLVVKFAKEHKFRYKYVFWVDGTSEATIKADLLDHVQSLGAEHSQKRFNEALAWFADENNQQWLIIYDNVDEINLNLSNMIPNADHGSIIITTRNRALGQLASELHLELGMMTHEEAIETLMRSARLVGSDSDEEAFGSVAKELGWLPVALVQAGSYIFQTKCSAEQYIQLLQEHRRELLELPAAAQRDKQHRSAYAAFDLSYRRIPIQVRRFLHLISFFHHANIPLAVVPYAARQGFEAVRFEYEADPLFNNAVGFLQETLCPSGTWEDHTLHKILISLQNYSLATFSPGITTIFLNIHPLIHSFYFDRLPHAESKLYGTAAARLLGCWDNAGHRFSEFQNASSQWGLIRHTKSMLLKVDEISLNDRASLAMIMGHLGTEDQAEKMWDDIIDGLISRHGSINLHVAEGCVHLARACSFNVPKGLRLLKEVVHIREKLLGPCHDDTIDARVMLGQRSLCAGYYTDAENILEKLQGEIPEDSPYLKDMRDGLARLYHRRAQYQKAAALQLQQLQFIKDKYGEAHMETIQAKESLAESYQGLGRYDDAEELYLQAARSMSQHQNEGYPQWPVGLVILYTLQGRYEEVETMIEANISMYEGRKDAFKASISLFAILRFRTARAELYYLQDRLDEAEQECDWILNQWKEHYSLDHPGSLRIVAILGHVYHATHRYAEAEATQSGLIDRRMKFHDGIHPYVINVHADLATTHYSQGRLDEAKKRQIWVLEQRREWLGDGHIETALGMYDLARSYQALGRLEEAKSLASQAKIIQENKLGKGHRSYKETVVLLQALEKELVSGRVRYTFGILSPGHIILAVLLLALAFLIRIAL